MPRLFPLFCFCVLLPLLLLLVSKAVGTTAKPAPLSKLATGIGNNRPAPFAVRAKAVAAKSFATQNGLSSRIAFLLDMRLPSGRKRFFAYDLQADSVLAAGLVAHGSCNRRFLPTAQFGNEVGGGCSSAGRYRVGGAYKGRFGKAFTLHGLDSSNANALRRHVVLHAYGCVPDEECEPYAICNSLGCTMVSYRFLATVAGFIKTEKKPVLLWVYN